MNIEVFKTNVQEATIADKLIILIHEHFPGNKINFDMHDCDKILRVEGENLIASNIVSIVNAHGFMCVILE